MTDQQYMELALEAAAKGAPNTWKNPLVGAVVVKNDQVLAIGYHHHYGQPHAERDAISQLSKKQLFNSTLYVTLEPCNHTGKQPPCSDLIVASGIKRVVIAQEDPHQIVAGKGIKKLRDHGIQVELGVLEQAARRLNRHYNFFYTYKRPWVCLKKAVSYDQQLGYLGQRTQITNQAAYDCVHQERSRYQAILVGSTTAIIDNPSLLTTANTDFPPIRIVLDRRGRLLQHLKIKVLTDGLAPTWIFTENDNFLKVSLPDFVKIHKTNGDSIQAVIKTLTEQELQSLYVEGGRRVAQSFLQAGLADEVLTYVSPEILGDGIPAWQENKNDYQYHFSALADNFRIAGYKHV